MSIKKSIMTIVVLVSCTYGANYPTETINKDSLVTQTLGGIDQANVFRAFRDDILLNSKEGKLYIETFYSVLSAAANVMVYDRDVRAETTESLSLAVKEVQEALENGQIPLEMGKYINSLLDSYASSSFANDKLIQTINNIKKNYPIAEFIEKFNTGKLTQNTEAYIKYKKDSILVTFKSGVTKQNIQDILNKYELTIKKDFHQIDAYLIEVPKKYQESHIESLINTLNQNNFVKTANLNGIVTALRTPHDTATYGLLWGLNNVGQQGGTYGVDIGAEKAWDKTIGSRNVVVGVLDTGVDYNHADLKANMWVNTREIPNNGKDDDNNGYIDDYKGWDFINDDNDPVDDEGHGTHCSGTIGAVGDNSVGIPGVAWRVRIAPLKFLDSCGSGSESDAIEGILYAADMGIKILSNSWGGNEYVPELHAAIEYYKEKGGLFIAASGNGEQEGDQNVSIMETVGKDNDNRPTYPASYPSDNIISVAAIDRNGFLAVFSNYGKKSVDIAAPGVDIMSTVPGSMYEYKSGTSMAAPHVAGVAALIKSINYNLNYAQIKDRILNTAIKSYQLQNSILTGGRLNAFGAVTNTVPPIDYSFLIPVWHTILF